MSLFDLKSINIALDELEQERGIPRAKVLSAIEYALGAAYKKEYGEKGQIIRAQFNAETGDVEFYQVKIVVDNTLVRMEDEERKEGDERAKYNEEHHILIATAKMMKRDVQADEEMVFPLETKEDFGRIASQTAKQVIMQKIREAERGSIIEEYGDRVGEIITGHVQRFERGQLFIDLGRATASIAYEDQIPGERYRQGERVRALLKTVDENARGSFLILTRSHPDFLKALFASEVPEMKNGIVEAKFIAREAGSRSKIAVMSHDSHVDPVGSLVGQRGVRVSTVMSELGGEKIDIIEWTADEEQFVKEALSPAEVTSVVLDQEKREAHVKVAEDQLSLAIGRGGQNVRLAAKLTGWKIDIESTNPRAKEEVAATEVPTVAEETFEGNPPMKAEAAEDMDAPITTGAAEEKVAE
jgi:transcription termination/antitermination protein NusA